MDVRKQEEIEFHNRLRNGFFEQRWCKEAETRVKDDPLWSNFKYYSVERKSLEYMRKWLKERCRGKVVLDYGCGNGEESLFVAREGASKVVGIDVSDTAIENCRKRALSIGLDRATDFRVNDGERLAFEDNYFDLAMEYGVLHHVDLDAAMRQLARVLKPQGQMICIETLGHNPIIRLYRNMTPHLRTKWEVEHIIEKKDFEKMANYFGSIHVCFFHLTTLAAVPFRNLSGFKAALTILEALDSILLKLPLLKWQAWMAVFILSEPRKSLA